MSGNMTPAGNTLLLFGPQSLSFNKTAFDQLRSTVTEGPSQRWILETVSDLPTYWNIICQHIPRLEVLPAGEWLTNLDCWFQAGAYPEDNFPLPNTLLTPLVVLTQLVQYTRNLGLSQPSQGTPGLRSPFSASPNARTLGFCTGVLSAFAVSCSASQGDYERYGAVAVRLAMLIGAVVDAQDMSDEVDNRAKSYATAWNSPEQGNDLDRIMDRFPEVGSFTSYAS